MNYMEAGNGRPSIVVDLTAFPYDCFVAEAEVERFWQELVPWQHFGNRFTKVETDLVNYGTCVNQRGGGQNKQ